MRQSWPSLYGFRRPVPKNLKGSGTHLSGTEYEVMPLSDCHLQIGRPRMSDKVEGLSHQRCSMRTKVIPEPHARLKTCSTAKRSGHSAFASCYPHLQISHRIFGRCSLTVLSIGRRPGFPGDQWLLEAEPTVRGRASATGLVKPGRRWTQERRGSTKSQNDRTAAPTQESQAFAYKIGKPSSRALLAGKTRYCASKLGILGASPGNAVDGMSPAKDPPNIHLEDLDARPIRNLRS
jgi:hypothetical protein